MEKGENPSLQPTQIQYVSLLERHESALENNVVVQEGAISGPFYHVD